MHAATYQLSNCTSDGFPFFCFLREESSLITSSYRAKQASKSSPLRERAILYTQGIYVITCLARERWRTYIYSTRPVLNPAAIELYRRPHHALNSSILSCLYTEFIDIIIEWDRLVWIFHYSAALGGDAPVCNCITCYYGGFLSLWYYIMLSSNWSCFLKCTFRHWHCKIFHYCYKIIKV